MLSKSHSIVVPYDLNLQQQIEVGRYDTPEFEFREYSFLWKYSPNVEVFLFGMGRRANLSDVEKEIDRQGFRSANHVELFAFGAQYPELQRLNTIVALGSAYYCRNYWRSYVALKGNADERLALHISVAGHELQKVFCDDDHRFLVVRKNPADEPLPLSFEQGNHEVVVHRDWGAEALIKRVGFYHVPPSIPEHLRIEGAAYSSKLLLLRFDRRLTRAEILSQMDRHFFRPGTAAELLAFCDQHYRSLSKNRGVVALGSVVQVGDRQFHLCCEWMEGSEYRPELELAHLEQADGFPPQEEVFFLAVDLVVRD